MINPIHRTKITRPCDRICVDAPRSGGSTTGGCPRGILVREGRTEIWPLIFTVQTHSPAELSLNLPEYSSRSEYVEWAGRFAKPSSLAEGAAAREWNVTYKRRRRWSEVFAPPQCSVLLSITRASPAVAANTRHAREASCSKASPRYPRAGSPLPFRSSMASCRALSCANASCASTDVCDPGSRHVAPMSTEMSWRGMKTVNRDAPKPRYPPSSGRSGVS